MLSAPHDKHTMPVISGIFPLRPKFKKPTNIKYKPRPLRRLIQVQSQVNTETRCIGAAQVARTARCMCLQLCTWCDSTARTEVLQLSLPTVNAHMYRKQRQLAQMPPESMQQWMLIVTCTLLNSAFEYLHTCCHRTSQSFFASARSCSR